MGQQTLSAMDALNTRRALALIQRQIIDMLSNQFELSAQFSKDQLQPLLSRYVEHLRTDRTVRSIDGPFLSEAIGYTLVRSGQYVQIILNSDDGREFPRTKKIRGLRHARVRGKKMLGTLFGTFIIKPYAPVQNITMDVQLSSMPS